MVKRGEAHLNHYAPRFYLRNFASDPDRKKITTLQKHGSRAVWGERSIKSIGQETDFHVREQDGQLISIEGAINARIENPISSSRTWRKIVAGRIQDLGRTDRAVLYALVRHLEVRTLHYRNMSHEVSELAANPHSELVFSAEEQEMYAQIRTTPGLQDEIAHMMASELSWAAEEFESSSISVLRFRIPIYASTAPVLVMKAPPHPALRSQQLVGLTPHVYVLPLSPFACVMLSIGDFGGAFTNFEAPDEVAIGLQRMFVAQFGYFPVIRHLVCHSDGLLEHLEWAGYKKLESASRHNIVFERRTDISVPVHRGPFGS